MKLIPFGSDDDYGFMMSGPESVSGLGSFGRAVTGSSASAHSGLVLDDVPEAVVAKERKPKRAVTGKGAMTKLIDEETQLGKEELLFGPEEGLLDEDSFDQEVSNYEKMFTNPLFGTANASLFESKVNEAIELQRAVRAKIQSTSGPSSEHVHMRNVYQCSFQFSMFLWMMIMDSCCLITSTKWSPHPLGWSKAMLRSSLDS